MDSLAGTHLEHWVYVQDNLLQQQSEQRCKLTMHLIADMELMARADYLVGALLP